MCERPLHSTGMEMGWVDFDCVNKILLRKINVGRMRGQSKASLTLDPDPRGLPSIACTVLKVVRVVCEKA